MFDPNLVQNDFFYQTGGNNVLFWEYLGIQLEPANVPIWGCPRLQVNYYKLCLHFFFLSLDIWRFYAQIYEKNLTAKIYIYVS
jgi:hypothetical protein